MSIENKLTQLRIREDCQSNYQYIEEFKNPNKLPITQIHLEKTWKQLRKDRPRGMDFLEVSPEEVSKSYFEVKTEVIPALDKRWLPRCVFHNYEPYSFTASKEENLTFLTRNVLFLDSISYLLNCNFHQFWCTILFEPSAVIALRSFLLSPISPYQVRYLEDEYLEVYKAIFENFLLVYEKLVNFKWSEHEYIPEPYGVKKLLEKKLLNLPIVITLVFLYRDSNLGLTNRITHLYFNQSERPEFLTKEIEYTIQQGLIVLKTIRGHLCDAEESAVVVPISIDKRPAIFSLAWVYSLVSYLLNTVATMDILFQCHKPAVQVALALDFPYSIPSIYVNVYRELYELLDNREEMVMEKELSSHVVDEINLGRQEFVEMYHAFVSFCLDEALVHTGDPVKQQPIIETYLRLIQTALEEDYFICDYNSTYSIATQNEMFETCCEVDKTCTDFLVSCVDRLPRNHKLQELSKMNRQTLEGVFRDFQPPPSHVAEGATEPSVETPERDAEDVERKIRHILDMFPHLGDGFILQCLESYDYDAGDVIDAILEGNLPPHLSEIPFDQIRIPPEPEPEKPVLAYKGKKPGYDDALKLLNDKSDIKATKTLVLEGVEFNYGDEYDDEYDDRFDDDVPIRVPDNPIDDEPTTFNPNRRPQRDESSDSGDDAEENAEEAGTSRAGRSGMNFCEDPAVLRARREANLKTKKPQPGPPKNKPDVVGKPKGQGQDKDVLLNRQKKAANKSSKANHNRKGGAQWKRTRGMIPS
ncbi:activating signal cointegrator 1 complex subunit 2 [Cylas formicarius]|uniref:activating signal cointegrator 1 complex subunit 2 n=1 Tax=Cylas formicarius TaxID=197179 RepID=UPI002958A006|nr:activating signal cointegrator 1 complex subunit 2 [Cylas formicarius]